MRKSNLSFYSRLLHLLQQMGVRLCLVQNTNLKIAFNMLKTFMKQLQVSQQHNQYAQSSLSFYKISNMATHVLNLGINNVAQIPDYHALHLFDVNTTHLGSRP